MSDLRHFLRMRAFVDLAEILDYSERLGVRLPVLHVGPDGMVRGSGEIKRDERDEQKESAR